MDIHCMRAVEQAVVEDVVHRTPNLSDTGARFVVCSWLDINRRRGCSMTC